jgi:hypothetical protein
VLNQRGDFATVVGIDNMIQAIHLRTETELRRHPFHKSFGLALPIGRPWSAANALFYSYFARRSFLQDPRIASVKQTKLTQQGGVINFSAEVQPAQSRKARAVNVAVR